MEIHAPTSLFRRVRRASRGSMVEKMVVRVVYAMALPEVHKCFTNSFNAPINMYLYRHSLYMHISRNIYDILSIILIVKESHCMDHIQEKTLLSMIL